jgi:hypothetical protein
MFFTVLAFGLCAVFQEPDAVLIGRMVGKNGCVLQLLIVDTEGNDTEMVLIGAQTHRYRVSIMSTYAMVAVDGQEFKVPREKTL